MGAEARVVEHDESRSQVRFAIDIRPRRKRSKDMEYVINKASDLSVEVLDIDAKDRHLLLYVRENGTRMLCGHDEKNWFVAGLSAPVSTVRDAKSALKPREIQEADKKLSPKKRNKRHNAAWKRQGEWFFIPDPDFVPETILRNEPLVRFDGSRQMGRPHFAEEASRDGGELRWQVWGTTRREELPERVQSYLTRGLITNAQREEVLNLLPEASRWTWRSWTEGAAVHVRGAVRHPDHATLDLHGWHRVVPNTERTLDGRRSSVQVAWVD